MRQVWGLDERITPEKINEGYEIEAQRYGRDKQVAINRGYIQSSGYRRKFDLISGSEELNRLLYQLAKRMLIHRSGTKYEDMYWVNLATNKVVAWETDSEKEGEIRYSQRTKKAIAECDQLLTIHSHPNSHPPSIADFNSNYMNAYNMGLVICHDGTVYMYESNEMVNEEYFSMVVAYYFKMGYNEKEAQISALNKMQQRFHIWFKEVGQDECIRK